MKTARAYPLDAVLLLGPTGVGKSPLGDALEKNGLFRRRCRHLDFGSELRGALSDDSRSAAYSVSELDFIHGVLERGLLLENEHFPLAEKILSLFLERVGFTQRDVLVFNGIPRHSGQAHHLAPLAKVHSLIVLDCTADDILRRIANNVGGDRTERMDDTRELIEKKLAIYRERTAPLIEHYATTGSVVYRLPISGATTTDQAYQRLLSLAAAHPPVALVAEPPQR